MRHTPTGLKQRTKAWFASASTISLVVLAGCSASPSKWMDPFFDDRPPQMVPGGRRVPMLNPGGMRAVPPPPPSAAAPAPPRPYADMPVPEQEEDGLTPGLLNRWFGWMEKSPYYAPEPPPPAAAPAPSSAAPAVSEIERMRAQRKPLPGNVVMQAQAAPSLPVEAKPVPEPERVEAQAPEPVSVTEPLAPPAVPATIAKTPAPEPEVSLLASAPPAPEPPAPEPPAPEAAVAPAEPKPAEAEVALPWRSAAPAETQTASRPDLLERLRNWLTEVPSVLAGDNENTATIVPVTVAESLPDPALLQGLAPAAQAPVPSSQTVMQPVALFDADEELLLAEDYPALQSVPAKPPALEKVKSKHPGQVKDLEQMRREAEAKKKALDSDPEPGSLLREYQGQAPAAPAAPAEQPAPQSSSSAPAAPEPVPTAPVPAAPVAASPGVTAREEETVSPAEPPPAAAGQAQQVIGQPQELPWLKPKPVGQEAPPPLPPVAVAPETVPVPVAVTASVLPPVVQPKPQSQLPPMPPAAQTAPVLASMQFTSYTKARTHFLPEPRYAERRRTLAVRPTAPLDE